jgi:hypothetical protein
MDGIKVEDEDEDEDEDDKVDISHMAELQRLDESPRQVVSLFVIWRMWILG